MMFPSIATIGLGLVITALLAVVDWYVWRMAPVLPYPRVAFAAQHDANDEAEALKEVA